MPHGQRHFGFFKATLLATLPLLAACDVAPRPIDLANSSIETPQEGYQVFADTMIASSTARRIAESCDLYAFDEAAKRRQMQFFEDEMERLAVDDPRTLNEIHRRLGITSTADEVAANGYNGLSSQQINTAFLLRNAGMTADIGGRGIGMVVRSGVTKDCADAEREIAQDTLAGRFLKRVQRPDAAADINDDAGGLAFNVTAPPRADNSGQSE